VQVRNDLRTVTEILIARHRSTAAATRWWFWGRTRRFGNLGAAQIDFDHNIQSYEMIHNANNTARAGPGRHQRSVPRDHRAREHP
jgi:hypothetical protein